MEWLPIESAPKDGKSFLGYWMRHYVNGERYEAHIPMVVMSYFMNMWTPAGLENDMPTHWMPLPPPPKE